MNVTTADIQRVAQDLLQRVPTASSSTSCRRKWRIAMNASATLRCRDLALGSGVWLSRPAASAQVAELAGRAHAAAAAAARGQVPAVRDPHARQRHAGHHRAAPRAAGGDDAPAGTRRRARRIPTRSAGVAEPRRRPARPGHRPRAARSRSPIRSTRSAASSAPAPATTSPPSAPS